VEELKGGTTNSGAHRGRGIGGGFKSVTPGSEVDKRHWGIESEAAVLSLRRFLCGQGESRENGNSGSILGDQGELARG
jgi:hypothetical protein